MEDDIIFRFNVYLPKDLSDALEYLDKNAPDAVPLAGGTDILIQIREGKLRPKVLVDLSGLKDKLSYVKKENGNIIIGALATVEDLAGTFLHKDPRYLGFLDVYKKFASPILKSIATIGGNIGVAVSASDYITLLLVFNAKIKLVSVKGERTVPLSELIVEKRTLTKQPNEIIYEIIFPETSQNSSTAFMKFDRREMIITGYVTTATYLQLSDGVIEDVRIAFDRVSKRFPERARKTEEFLKGKEFSIETIRQAYNEILPKEMVRKSDYRASAEYRLDMSKVMMKRALLKSKSRIEGGA